MRYILVVFFFSSLNVWAVAQDSLAMLEKARLAYQAQDFAYSLDLCEIYLLSNREITEVLYMAGESARQLGKSELANAFFNKIQLTDRKVALDVTENYLADSNNFSDMTAPVKALLSSPATEPSLMNKVKAEAGHYHPQSSLAHIRPLGGRINAGTSSFAPLRYADRIYFTSAVEQKTGEGQVTRIFSTLENQTLQPTDESPGKKEANYSHLALMPDASKMFFTTCRSLEKGGSDHCEIWWRSKNYEGSWGPAIKLPNTINMRGFTATQPSIGWDLSSKNYVLYFVSDRPGGIGKLDIWASVLKANDEFGEPFLLPFNTAGNEVTPYFFQPGQQLFFSSDALQQAANFDIFLTQKTGTDTWTTPEPLEFPLNSPADDLYFTLHATTKQGYFASNRTTDPVQDKSFEIFEADFFVPIEISAFSASDSSALNDASIEIFDRTNGARSMMIPGEDGNVFSGKLQLGRKFYLTARKEGFLPATLELSTEDLLLFDHIKDSVFLNRN